MYLTACSICKAVATSDNCCSKCLRSRGKSLKATSVSTEHHPGTARGTGSQQGQIKGTPPQGAPEDSNLQTQNVALSPDGFHFEGYLKNIVSLSFSTKFA